MKRIIQATIISALLIGAYAQASLILTPDSTDQLVATSDDCKEKCGPGTRHILDWLEDYGPDGFDRDLELYKSEENSTEENPVAEGLDSGVNAYHYTTKFSDPVGDPGSALITWDGPAKIWGAEWLLVKDGGGKKDVPIWYLFDISGWDGEIDIVLDQFWPDNGAISHVSIYGVPEPGTLALLGIGLLGAALSRRKKAA